MFMLVSFVYDTVPYQEGTILQLCCTAACCSGGQHHLCKIEDDRQQTTCGEHNGTTLPHSSSGRQHHLCAHGVSSLCCGELLVSEPVICHPTIPHVSVVLPLWVRVSIDAET